MAKVPFNPFGGDSDKLGVTMSDSFIEAPAVGLAEPEPTELGEPAPEIDAQTMQMAEARGMGKEMEALANGDASAMTQRMSQELDRVSDIINRAQAHNIPAQIDIGVIEQAVNSGTPNALAIGQAMKEIDNANQVEARVVNHEITQGIAGGSAAIGGLATAISAPIVAGAAGTPSADEKVADHGSHMAKKFNIGNLNALEKSVDGAIIPSDRMMVADAPDAHLMNKRPLDTPVMHQIGINLGMGA